MRAFEGQHIPYPDGRLRVAIEGRRWMWRTTYPDEPLLTLASSTEDEVVTMVLPVDTPVALTVSARDVEHHLSIPELGVEVDVVPGAPNTVEFTTPPLPQVAPLMCTSDCGELASKMRGRVMIVGSLRFERIRREVAVLSSEPGESVVQYGARVATCFGCTSCHSDDGTPSTGPTWRGLWGSKRSFADPPGFVVEEADEEYYLMESILEPGARVVDGFSVEMPAFEHLDDEKARALVELIRSLR